MELRATSLRGAGILLILLITQLALGQGKIIRGYVKDKLSDERIPFASVSFKLATTGRLTDSAGSFILRVDHWPTDTLLVTYVGYQDLLVPLSPELAARLSTDNGQSIDLVLQMVRGKMTAEVVVKR
ncbi:MAG TPA: carboxypeptidase-like regulatory domain-containing protein, partial [Flavihumibacter sp.]|nr:carboxypeptidase-like regulatory domain-containing protein [Flavihumibacter sp.]